MVFEGLDAAILIEMAPSLAATPAPQPESGPTLDEAMRRIGQPDTGPGARLHHPIDREIMREATMLDLWIEDAGGLASRPLRIGASLAEAPNVDPGAQADEGFVLGDPWSAPSPVAFEDWEEPLNFNPEQYAQEVATWYGFDSFGFDQLSDKLEEWGRQIQDWIHSIIPGGYPEVVVTGPSGVEFGDGFEVIFHGDGLISLFRDGVFLHGLEATTANHATIVVTIANPTYGGGVTSPRGGVEVQTSGGSTITYYFRPGQ